jgi:hypothetical protein
MGWREHRGKSQGDLRGGSVIVIPALIGSSKAEPADRTVGFVYAADASGYRVFGDS